MKRRDFLQKIVAGTVLFPSLLQCKRAAYPFNVLARENPSALAHRLLSKDFPAVTSTQKTDILVIGAGVTGLTLGWQLSKKGIHNFEVIEVAKEYGGNAAYGENEYTKFPWAAHYLPIANNDNTSLIDFLKDVNVIVGEEGGLPLYNERYLNFAPQEALWVHHQWQEGLVPHTTLTIKEREEMHRFFKLMQDFGSKKGNDDLYFFTIPKALGSLDTEMHFLDSMSLFEFIERHHFNSPFLRWYLDYCCKDEYGAPPEKISAWAGVHYFACRRGRGANCQDNHYLVWPEGNGFLTDALAKPFLSKIRLQHVCFDIEATAEGVSCLVYDEIKNESIRYEVKKCVLCTPLFVSKRLVSKYLEAKSLALISQLQYYPWVTANIVFNTIKPNYPAWDNVFFQNASLGLVYAQHQSVSQNQDKKTFTYYRNFSEKSAKEERVTLFNLEEEAIVTTILHDTRDFYSRYEDIESIHYNQIGHGMISPVKGVPKSAILESLCTPLKNNIYLAHSDLSGYSVFEEAFFHGTRIANELSKSSYF